MENTSATAAAMEQLWEAIENEDASLVENILKRTSTITKCNNINQTVTSHGMTLLHLAVGLNALPIVKLLLNYGADPNSLECEDKTSPLHLSVIYEYELIIDALMKAGGNPYLEDGEHKNCFSYVKEQGLDHLNCYLEPKIIIPSSNPAELSSGSTSANSTASTVGTFYSCNSSMDPDERGNTRKSEELVPAMESMKLESIMENKPIPTSAASPNILGLTHYTNAAQIVVGHSLKVESPEYRTPKRPAGTATYFSSPEMTPISTVINTGYGCGIGARAKAEENKSHPSTSAATNGSRFQETFETQNLTLKYKGLMISHPNPNPTSLTNTWNKIGSSPAFREDTNASWHLSPLENRTGITSIMCPYEFTDDDSIFSGATSTISGSDYSNTSNSISSDEKSVDSNASEWKPPVKSKPPSQTELDNLKSVVKNSGIPVTSSTYPILAKLAKSPEKKNIVISPPSEKMMKGFSHELQFGIKNIPTLDSWGNNIEIEIADSGIGKSKSFFNYLLIDPRITKRMNFNSKNTLKTNIITNSEKFEHFLNSIFYIGKGHAKRPIQHLVDAKKLRELSISRAKKLTPSEKCNKILQIWESGQGVIVLSIFQFSSEKESCVKEASMIDAIGLQGQDGLTNLVKGSYSGSLASNWTQKKKNQYGSFLLHKAFCNFVFSETHKEFFSQDIQA